MTAFSILVVDDNEADRYLLRRKLRSTGMISKIFEADDGQTALELFSNYKENVARDPDEFPPELILLDINMPLVGGLEFLEKFNTLRQELECSSTVVMMYSSSERPEDREQAFFYEFVKGFITKGTYSSDELADKISSVLT